MHSAGLGLQDSSSGARLQVPGMFNLSPTRKVAGAAGFNFAHGASPATARRVDATDPAPSPSPPLSLNIAGLSIHGNNNGPETPTFAHTPTVPANSAATSKRKGTQMSDLSSEGGENNLAIKLKHLVYRRLPTVKLDEDAVSLKDFSLGTTLGTGTFGRVNLVQQKSGNKAYFALKSMKKHDIVRLKQVDHIISEASLLKELSHPFIVNLCATLQDSKRLYLVMEYVPGGELFSYLRRERKIPDEYARFYAAELVLALDYLHSRGIAYRDLKPENLLLSRTGHLKITDFGFAKKVDGRTWTLCGTPEYLAPEIIQSKGHGKGVDWWALGILIYEMLAGYPPFYDDSPVLIYQKILRGNIEWPGYFDSRAQTLISRLLNHDVSQRLGCLRNGAEDVANELWFEKVKWQSVLDKLVSAPFFPPVKHPGDSTNFDEYEEEDEFALVSGVKPEEEARFAVFGPYRDDEDRNELLASQMAKPDLMSASSASSSASGFSSSPSPSNRGFTAKSSLLSSSGNSSSMYFRSHDI